MKATVVCLFSLVSVAAAASPLQEPIDVVLGPKAYRDGDVIEIVEVKSTSKNLEQGDSITVSGRVRLQNRTRANLCLFVTQTAGSGWEETDSSQCVSLGDGLRDFELKTTIKHQGALHLTMYDEQTGKPFGGVYFGTARQMNDIRDWSVRYYLQE